MSNLDRRITKLEAGQPSDENIVCARAPGDWSDDRCRKHAEEIIGDRFNGEDFKLSVDRACNIDEFKVLFATTAKDLDRIMKHIGKNPRRITDGRFHQPTKEAR